MEFFLNTFLCVWVAGFKTLSFGGFPAVCHQYKEREQQKVYCCLSQWLTVQYTTGGCRVIHIPISGLGQKRNEIE